MLSHGKMTHTILFSIIFLIIYYFTKHEFWYGFWFGFIIHLAGDDIQGMILQWLFFPIKRKAKYNNNEER